MKSSWPIGAAIPAAIACATPAAHGKRRSGQLSRPRPRRGGVATLADARALQTRPALRDDASRCSEVQHALNPSHHAIIHRLVADVSAAGAVSALNSQL